MMYKSGTVDMRIHTHNLADFVCPAFHCEAALKEALIDEARATVELIFKHRSMMVQMAEDPKHSEL